METGRAMMKKLVWLSVLGLTATPAWALGPVDVDVQVGAWSTSVSGDVRDGSQNIDVEDDLSIDDETLTYGRARLHLPFLGNVYLGYVPLDYSGENTVTRTVTFRDETFTVGTEVRSDIEMNAYDLGWTATVLDLPGADFELGLNVKFIEGEVTLRDDNDTATADFSVPVPQLKAVVSVGGPFFSAVLDGNGIAYGGNHLFDVSGEVRLQPAPLFYVAGGYRHLDLKIEDGDSRAQITSSGPFVGIGLDF